MIFRFDDICANTDMVNTTKLMARLRMACPDCEIQYAVSPLCDTWEEEDPVRRQFVFEPIKKAYSDYRLFYNVGRAHVPWVPLDVRVVSHGLIHVDHRLLSHPLQEMSILIAASLLNTKMFAPPFNKWNADTESICTAHGLHLQKFEDGWRGMDHEPYDEEHTLWYLHGRHWDEARLKGWLSSEASR